jgi:hypothetical protein
VSTPIDLKSLKSSDLEQEDVMAAPIEQILACALVHRKKKPVSHISLFTLIFIQTVDEDEDTSQPAKRQKTTEQTTSQTTVRFVTWRNNLNKIMKAFSNVRDEWLIEIERKGQSIFL